MSLQLDYQVFKKMDDYDRQETQALRLYKIYTRKNIPCRDAMLVSFDARVFCVKDNFWIPLSL
ncbi:hypothetical protein [Candidatus Parabeggiatoa sp. HSG14]|uniref:hypothetical protein n=1 Tax=Candidatus Parabeggiatoa sp. HSG14 TaxID=3055593 RepID=UPI0025A7B712|nr:hypothetical protein [Thiotrichales bacterium HSG14]